LDIVAFTLIAIATKINLAYLIAIATKFPKREVALRATSLSLFF